MHINNYGGSVTVYYFPLHVTKYCIIIDVLTRTVIYTGNVDMFYACTSITIVEYLE